MRQYILLCPCVSSSVFRDTRQLSPDPASSLGQPWAELRRETRVQLRQSRDIRVITGAVTSPTLTSGASVTCTSVPVMASVLRCQTTHLMTSLETSALACEASD